MLFPESSLVFLGQRTRQAAHLQQARCSGALTNDTMAIQEPDCSIPLTGQDRTPDLPKLNIKQLHRSL